MRIDDVQKICVAGAGQMGAQIAVVAAMAGYDVALYDISEEQLDKALAGNRLQLERRVKKGRIELQDAEAALARISPTDDLAAAAADAECVIEAVVELLEVKKELFEQLDELTPEHAVLATNSSYIGNSQLAAVTRRPERVVNMHFFFPPMVMKLVEVVRGEATSKETVELAAELARRLGKTPVVLHKEVPGFLVNRVLRAISNEAYNLLESGVASFADIDLACELGLNHPMGPFRLGDFSGLDVGYNNRLETFQQSGDEKDRPPRALARRVERGELGRKTGRGFYDYSTDPPSATED